MDHRGERAVLWLLEGVVVRVDMQGTIQQEPPMARLMHVLDWEGGDFALSAEEPTGAQELDVRTTYVLLEHARRRDEHA